jgi:hypothetical protein
MVNRPLHLCIETWNATLVKRWVEIASKEEIFEAIDLPSPVGTALCMAAALKKEHEKGNYCISCTTVIRYEWTCQLLKDNDTMDRMASPCHTIFVHTIFVLIVYLACIARGSRVGKNTACCRC